MNTTLSSSNNRIITTCELRVRTNAYRGLFFQCVETSNGMLLPAPTVANPPPIYLADMKRLAKRSPVIKARNPSGRLLAFEMQRFYEAQTRFDGTVPYYDTESEILARIPVDELAPPYTCTISPDGQAAFSNTPQMTQDLGSDVLPDDFEMKLEGLFTILSEHFPTETTSEAFVRSCLTTEDPKAQYLSYQRVASAYQSCVSRMNMNSLERAECFILLLSSPHAPAKEIIDSTPLVALTKKRARKVIEAYHAVPGTPPPVHYRITIEAIG